MLTAKEASEAWNDFNKEAELFIELIIEPAIKNVMTDETVVKIPLIEDWIHGTVYRKPKDLKVSNSSFDENLSVLLTNEINNILEENGYTVTKEYIIDTTEHQKGYGNFVIEWD